MTDILVRLLSFNSYTSCRRQNAQKWILRQKKFLVEFVSHTQYIEDDWEGRNCQDLEMTITQELFLTGRCPLNPVWNRLQAQSDDTTRS